MLTGPAVPLAKAAAALDGWNPQAVAHDFEPAWDLAAQLSESSGRIVFLTNHLPPKSAPADLLRRPLQPIKTAAAGY